MRHAIADLQERKQAAVKYLRYQTERLWKTTDAWADATKTYEEFKAEFSKLYPGSTSDRTFTMQDMDALSRTDSACLVFTGYHVKDTKPCYLI